jgi:stage II sporulation protein D
MEMTVNKEPIMSIGLVMPEDNQKDISLFLNGDNFDLSINDLNQTHFNKNLLISSKDQNMFLEGNECESITITNNQRIPANHIVINSVIAGRGFHWQKRIKIKVIGDLIIKIIDHSLFVVNRIYLEDYLMCVATSEMGSNCPPSLLEAQTIVARSWILAAEEKKHELLEVDACNDDCCQRYQGISNLTKSSIEATLNTRGKAIMYRDTICDARYSKSCGGITENGENVWIMDQKPYLKSRTDENSQTQNNISNEESFKNWMQLQHSSFCGPQFIDENKLGEYLGNVDKNGNYYRWEISYNLDELKKIIFDKTGKLFTKIDQILPLKRGASGRILHLDIIGALKNKKNHKLSVKSEYEIRRILHPKFLYSSAFTIETNSNTNSSTHFTLKGAGWGHGVGLCQIGALGMSLAGKKTEEILSHYYKQTMIKGIYG